MVKNFRCILFLDIDFSYECAVNIEALIKLEDVMPENSLGPNGGEFCILIFLFFVLFIFIFGQINNTISNETGLVYCMEYLEKNIDWLEFKLKPLLKG